MVEKEKFPKVKTGDEVGVKFSMGTSEARVRVYNVEDRSAIGLNPMVTALYDGKPISFDNSLVVRVIK